MSNISQASTISKRNIDTMLITWTWISISRAAILGSSIQAHAVAHGSRGASVGQMQDVAPCGLV